MSVFRLIALAFLLFPFLVSGQQLHFNSRALEFNNEPLKVKKLYLIADGFIWLGTAQGLFQYDGLHVKPIFPENATKSIPAVSSLFQAKNKQLWIGCENGEIFLLINRKLTRFSPQATLPKERILAITEDLQGNIWLATYGEGLFCWKKNRLCRFNTADGLPDDYVYTLTRDKKGNIWAGTDRGIGICNFSGNRKKVTSIGTAQGLPDNIVTALAICPDKATIWAGTYSGGFCTINAETQKVTVPEISKNWSSGVISAILPLSGTTSLVATAAGLQQFDTRTPRKLTNLEPAKPTGFKISDLLLDAEGRIWLAGNTAELKVANPALRFLPFPENKPAAVLALLPDSQGTIWYSTDAGLFCAQPTTSGYDLKPRFEEQPFQQFKVISLFQDRQGWLWAGTFGGGIFRLDPETGLVKRYTEKNGLVNDNVLSITGRGKELWLATLGGASRVKFSANGEPEFESFNQQDGLGFNYIYQVLADRQNRIWFATDGKGLTKLENGNFTNYTEKDGLQTRTVYSLAQTKDGSIWASSPKNGLFRFKNGRFTPFSTANGLRDLNISSLSTDKAGNLLVFHQKGLDVLAPETGQLRYLGLESGLQEMGQDLNATGKDRNGTVWFGGQNGLVAYQPIAEKLPVQPRLQLTDVQLFLKPIASQPSPEFDHDENHITFEYAGLWFQQPEEVRYKLKLEGYDREFSFSNNRSITYPRLPAGKYRFLVSASATGNFEKAQTIAYPFEVKKPFWNTIWFYLLVSMGLGGLLFGFIKTREKRLKKAERLEKDKVMFQFETLKNQVNPHFLFNSFNTLINIIEDDQEAAVAYVEKLSDFFRDILVYREKDTITLREELVLIRNYYFLQQKRYGANLQLEITIPQAEEKLLVAPLTLQLLVENAIKHNVVSRDKPLSVAIFTEAGAFLVVRNNLQKKKLPETSTGIGLANICNRYAILTKEPVVIKEMSAYFEVRIPFIFPPAP